MTNDGGHADDGNDLRASGTVASGRDVPPDQPRLQLFYSQDENQDKHVAGFGWMNDRGFYHAQYDMEELNFKSQKGFLRLVLKSE